jgi:hypothetical protein
MSIAAYNHAGGYQTSGLSLKLNNNNKRPPLSTIYSATSSAATQAGRVPTREQCSAPEDMGDLESMADSEQDYAEGTEIPSEYATNNPPLILFDNMADTISAHRQLETDWSMIYTGKMDLLFYDSSVQRQREDLSISKKFTGDMASWPEFKAVVHSNINLKRYLHWGEKCNQIIKYLGPPAIDFCDWSDRSRQGYIMALHSLEREYGGFDKLESALYNKLATIPAISLDPATLHAPKMVLRQILKANAGGDTTKAERLFFDRVKWDPKQEENFRQFILARGSHRETAALFEDWAGGSRVQSDYRRRGQETQGGGRELFDHSQRKTGTVPTTFSRGI